MTAPRTKSFLGKVDTISFTPSKFQITVKMFVTFKLQITYLSFYSDNYVCLHQMGQL